MLNNNTTASKKESRTEEQNRPTYLIERGQDAITGILDLAREQEHPRTYEVAGQLIKTVSEVTERLADLQEKMQRLKEVPDKGPSHVTNALFIGSTKELQSLISKEKTNGR